MARWTPDSAKDSTASAVAFLSAEHVIPYAPAFPRRAEEFVLTTLRIILELHDVKYQLLHSCRQTMCIELSTRMLAVEPASSNMR